MLIFFCFKSKSKIIILIAGILFVKLVNKVKKIQMNSYILILFKIYQNYIQMQRQSNHLYIKVQTCCNCHLHSWCTRHDQSKYNAFYQKFQTMIKAHLPKAVLSRNQPPAHYQRVYDSPQGPDRYIDQNNYEVSYPRSGAFQISVNGVQIFSKLKSSLWPSIERVVKLIMNIDKDIKQKEDIQKYSLQYRLQNDHDFSFVQTYRAELKRKQMVKVFTHDKPISSGGNRSFKSRRLFSNSKTKKKSTQPEQSSPIINSRKFQGSHLIKLNQNIHQISDFNDEQEDRQIYKWKLKESSHKKQQQNLIKKTPLLINKSKVMQKLKNKSGILKDNKAKEDQINLHRLIDEKLEEGQSKNSSKMNNTKKVEEKREIKNEDDSGGKLKGWSDKEQKSKSDFVINETSNSLRDKRQQVETKKKPSINQKLQENQEEDYQFILEQSHGQQNIAKNRKLSKDQQKIYLKPKDQDQKSYAESNEKKSLHIEQTFSQKSLDKENYYQIYEKIANWQAVYTESQEDYEVYQFTLLLMSKNFGSQPSDKHEIQSFQQFEEQNLDVFRVKQVEVKQIKYKQLVYHKYAQINWNTKYKNGFKLEREGEEDMQSFCEQIMDDNEIDEEVKIQDANKVQNNIEKNKKRKQKQQKLAAQLKKFHQAVNLTIQTAYPHGQNWVALYQNNHFTLNKESKIKHFQPKQEKTIIKMPVQSYQQQKWICKYSNNQFKLQKKSDKSKVAQNQTGDKLIQKDIKVDSKKQIKETKQIKINLENYTEDKWTAQYSKNGFQLRKIDKPKLSKQNTDKPKIQVKVQDKSMIKNNEFKTTIKQQLLDRSKYQEEKWVGEYQNGKYELQKRNNQLKPELRQQKNGEKEIVIKNQVTLQNKKETKVENKKADAIHTVVQGYNQQKWIAQQSNGQFLLQKKQMIGKPAVKVPVEVKINQVKAEGKIEKTSINSQKPEIKKKEIQIKQVYNKSDHWLAEYSQGRFQLFKKEQNQNTNEGKKQKIKTENHIEHTQIKEVKKANSEQVTQKKIQIKQQPKKQSIQISKEKTNQIKKETIYEAPKIKNQNEKKQMEKNKQTVTSIAIESILWIGQYQGIEFILKKDENISKVTKTGDEKNSIIPKSQNQPKQQEKANKINKNEEKEPNIICWTGKYKNNQYLLQKIISV